MKEAVLRRRTDLHVGHVGRFGLEDVCLPNGAEVTLEVLRHPGAAAVLPLHDDGTVTLLRQYRHAGGGWLLEVPAGKLEPGEDPLDCARRELQEEAGVAATTFTLLTSLRPAPAYTDEVIHLYLATGLTPTPQALEADEVIEVIRVPLAEAVAEALAGRVPDAKTLACLLLAHAAR